MKNGTYAQRMAKWAAQRKKIIALDAAGVKQKDIAKRFRRSPARINQIVHGK